MDATEVSALFSLVDAMLNRAFVLEQQMDRKEEARALIALVLSPAIQEALEAGVERQERMVMERGARFLGAPRADLPISTENTGATLKVSALHTPRRIR